MQSASGSYRNLAALAEGFGDALAEGKDRSSADKWCYCYAHAYGLSPFNHRSCIKYHTNANVPQPVVTIPNTVHAKQVDHYHLGTVAGNHGGIPLIARMVEMARAGTYREFARLITSTIYWLAHHWHGVAGSFLFRITSPSSAPGLRMMRLGTSVGTRMLS